MTMIITTRDIVDIKLSDIILDEANQPRAGLSNVDGLAAAIKATGKLTPIFVYPSKDKFVVVDGHHRFAAAQLLELETIPAEVFHSENDAMQQAFVESAALNRHQSAWNDSEATRFTQNRLMGVDIETAAAVTDVCVENHEIMRAYHSKNRGEQPKQLTIHSMQAIMEAEADGNNELAEAILEAGSSWSGERLLQERAEQAELDARVAKLKKAGIKVIKKPRKWNDSETTYFLTAVGGKKLTQRHQCGCDGFRFSLSTSAMDWRDEPAFICTKPDNHPEDMPSEIERKAREAKEKHEDARRKAENSRTVFIKKLLIDKDSKALARTNLVNFCLRYLIHHATHLVSQLESTGKKYGIELNPEDINFSNAQSLIMCGCAEVEIKHRYDDRAQHSEHFIEYLKALQALSYKPTKHEEEILAKAKPKK